MISHKRAIKPKMHTYSHYLCVQYICSIANVFKDEPNKDTYESHILKTGK